MKRRYCVSGHVVVSAETYVEAESEQEARKIARSRPIVLTPNGPTSAGVSLWDTVCVESADGTFTGLVVDETDTAPDEDESDYDSEAPPDDEEESL